MVVKIHLLIVGLMLTLFQEKQTTVMVFGDSITAGYGLSPEEAFPALVEKNLRKKGKAVQVINAGLSGETSAGGLSRVDWILRKPIDIFVLELGGNDGLRGLPLEQTEKNLQAIIDKVKAKYPNAKIVVAGMQVPPNLGKAYTDRFRDIFPRLAANNKATLIPFLLEGVGGNEKFNLPDQIHPNAEGHKILAENVIRILEPLL